MSAVDDFLKILDKVEENDPLFDMNFAVPGSVPYAHARIATDMVPLAQPHLVNGGSEILIVGNDGENVTSEGYPWTENLKSWVRMGNRIKYLLVNPTEKAVARLRQACAELTGAKGSLEVISIDFGRSIEETDSKFIRRWAQFHFVTFDNPKQLWVEENHPPGSTEAEGCTYYPPTIAEDVALWSILKRQFERITSKYAFSLASSVS